MFYHDVVIHDMLVLSSFYLDLSIVDWSVKPAVANDTPFEDCRLKERHLGDIDYLIR